MTRYAAAATHQPTRSNGALVPFIRTITLIEVGEVIGEGTDRDSFRMHYSYHMRDGTRLLSLPHPIEEPQS